MIKNLKDVTLFNGLYKINVLEKFSVINCSAAVVNFNLIKSSTHCNFKKIQYYAHYEYDFSVTEALFSSAFE